MDVIAICNFFKYENVAGDAVLRHASVGLFFIAKHQSTGVVEIRKMLMEVLKWFQKLRDTELWIPCEDTTPIADHTSRVFTIVESDTECMADPP